MVKSLYSGVSGLKTHQQRMDVIGNNIANVNTTAYKSNVTTFADVYYQTKRTPSAATATLGGVNPRQVGYGVKMNSTTANMTQSGFTYSDNIYDIAIDGEGFFQVMDGSGNIFYTRAGVFNIDESGYLVNANGYHVLGVTGDSTGQEASSEIIRAIVPSTEAKCSSATKTVNGSKVTLSVSAPSNYTDMSVTFTEAEFPYATYANGILNIYFNSDEQYNSEDAFEQAINKAIQAGGVTLPDDVELQFEFESIPDNPEAVLAKNSINGLNFKTNNDSCMFHSTYIENDAAGVATTKHAYIGFATDQVYGTKVNVELKYDAAATDKAAAVWDAANNTWTITINDYATAEEINTKIKEKTANDATIPELTCTNFVLPGDAATKSAVLTKMSQKLATDGTDKSSGGFDVAATVEGEYANSYKITFAYVSGYGKTNAVWDENNLTITVCNDTTIADINEKIKVAARGNEKKVITMANISGLKNNSTEYSTPVNNAGTYERNMIETDINGVKKVTAQTSSDGVTWTDGTVTYTKADGTVGAAADFTAEPATSTEWNPAMRQAFFGGNPAISPMGGEDSFFTKTAKSLSTFALEDGRTGSEQAYKDLSDVTIQTDGTIIGKHAVHGDIILGRIDIATFDNPNGLSQVGGTMFAQTVASGEAKLCVAGEDGAGEVLAGALEMSNVDLSQEFTDMITTQRGFQANSRVITVSDTMLEELLSLKR